jgi:hypothetical protein
MSIAVIDLDRLPADDGPPPRRRFVRPVRPVLGALCVVLLALLGGATILPSPTRPVTIPARLTDTTFVQGDELYLTGQAARGAAQRLDIYHLPDGKRLAAFTVPVTSSVELVTKIGDVYLVGYRDVDDSSSGLVAINATTGGVLWKSRYALWGLAPAAGFVLLTSSFYQPGSTTYAVDVHTGVQRWSIPAGNFLAVDVAADGGPRWLVQSDGAGQVTVYDGSTGAVVATATLPDIPAFNAAGVSEGTHELVISTNNGRVSAYALPGLTPRWKTAVKVPSSWGALDCGTLFCFGHQQQGTTAVDPATGRLVWASDRWTYADQAGGNLVMTSREATLESAELTVLDSATGKVRGELGEWHYLTTADPNGTRYVQHDTGKTNEIVFGEVDWQGLTVRVAGVGEQISGNCQSSGDIVVCRLVDSSVAVYRLG